MDKRCVQRMRSRERPSGAMQRGTRHDPTLPPPPSLSRRRDLDTFLRRVAAHPALRTAKVRPHGGGVGGGMGGGGTVGVLCRRRAAVWGADGRRGGRRAEHSMGRVWWRQRQAWRMGSRACGGAE